MIRKNDSGPARGVQGNAKVTMLADAGKTGLFRC